MSLKTTSISPMSEKFDPVTPLVNNVENDTNLRRKDAEAQLRTVEIVDGGLQAWATLVGACVLGHPLLLVMILTLIFSASLPYSFPLGKLAIIR